MRNDMIILVSEDVESLHMGPRCSFVIVVFSKKTFVSV